MLNTRQNIHKSKLPKLGEVVTNPFDNERYIVTSFPLCDNVGPWSIGIHTCNIMRLADGKIKRIAGHWLVNNEI